MNPIEALERELMAAAARGPIRRRPPRRTLLLAAALALVVAAVPAWATGLLADVFHQGSPPKFGGVPTIKGQRDYVIARGVTARGEPWRLAIEKNGPLQQKNLGPDPARLPRRKFDCWALTIGPPPQGGGGECAYAGMARGRPTVALNGITEGRVSRRDHRLLVQFTTLSEKDRLSVTLRSGRRFFVRPMQIDQAKLARTGLHFPFGIVVFTIPSRDRIKGITVTDSAGRNYGTFMQPAHVPASARTVQSPAL
jgi:hypothetical protein